MIRGGDNFSESNCTVETENGNLISVGKTNGTWFRENAYIVAINKDGNHNVEIANNELSVKDYQLSQCYPNPFNPSTTIKFSLPKMSNVKLSIFNSKGELVQTLINNKNIEAGWHKVKFDGSKLSSGIYYYRIKADNFNADQRMLLLK